MNHEKVLPQPCWQLDLGLPSLYNWEQYISVVYKHISCSILSQQPKWTKGGRVFLPDRIYVHTSTEDLSWDFPGDPVVETLSFQCRGREFHPGWKTKIPYMLHGTATSPPAPPTPAHTQKNINNQTKTEDVSCVAIIYL